MFRAIYFWIFVSFSILTRASLSFGTTRVVDQAGTTDFLTIQSAASVSSAQDTVLVLPGIYEEHLVLPSGLILISRDGPVYTIIDGTETGRVVQASSVTLQGFTVSNGMIYDGSGAGILGNGLITNCLFFGNRTATYNNLNGGAVSGPFQIYDSRFENNAAQEKGGAVAGATLMERCEFFGNGSRAGWGGAVYQGACVDCVFEGNTAHSGGSATYEASLDGCTIGPHSGTVSVLRDSYSVRGCLIYGCTSGPAIDQSRWAGQVENCTVATSQTAIAPISGITTAQNCIFWENTNIYTYGMASRIAITCSVSWNNGNGNPDEGTNLVADPMFCSPETFDFSLDASSPCAAENNVECGLVGARDVACGVVETKSTSLGDLKALFQ